jgi:O-antigen ligase
MSRDSARSTTASRSPHGSAGSLPPGEIFAPRRTLEQLTLIHLGGLLLLATWYFGGGSALARSLISAWGSLGLVITVSAIVRRPRAPEAFSPPLWWVWPVLAFNALVLASCLNPSFSEKTFAGESLLAHTGAAHPALPSTAHVGTSLRHLWLFDALYFSALNLTLISRTRALRRLFLFACGNVVVLSVFGTLQKLTSDGLFFGAVPSPNARFFATFVYGNHWAALVVLSIAAAGGLLFRHLRRHDGSSAAHGRTSVGVTALLLMAITPLVAGSRAGTIMVVILLVGYGARLLLRVSRQTHGSRFRRVVPVATLIVCGGVAAGVSVWLGNEALQDRWKDTQHQWQGELLQGRRELYRDTWKLVTQQPLFGWGLGSYEKVFQLIRPRPLEANRQYERSYADAHSDVLQALAEVGFTGALLLGLAALLPLTALRPRHLRSTVIRDALFGCGLIALYSLVEFPFGNPAVVATWWFFYFGAIHYARLQAPPETPSGKAPGLPA